MNAVDISRFGGLSTVGDYEDVSGAIGSRNVLIYRDGGAIGSRPGYTLNGTLDLSYATAGITRGSNVVLAGGTKMEVVNTSGSSLASRNDFTTGTPWSLVNFGFPGTTPTITNPGFETNTTGWAAGTSTITRDTSNASAGTAGGRWDNTGASDALGGSDTLTGTVFSGTFFRGVAYTIAFDMKCSGASLNVTTEFGTTSDNTSAAQVLGSSYGTLYLVWTPTATTSAASVRLKLTYTGGTGYAWVDNLNLSQPGGVYGANGVTLGRVRADNTIDNWPYARVRAVGSSTWSPNSASPQPKVLGIQPKDNRMVAGGFTIGVANGPGNAESSPSHVYFSQPDDPEAWDLSDYVVLSPGDGETIGAICAWGDYLFVFKSTKFFVFYGNSVDSTGGTVFNYRTVDNAFPEGTGISPGNVCVAPDGVYVLTNSGVYKTTGGAPQLVSGKINGCFLLPDTNINIELGSLKIYPNASGTGGAFWHGHRCFFNCTLVDYALTSTSGWLVYDQRADAWMTWVFADNPGVGIVTSGLTPENVYFPSGVSTVGRKGLLRMKWGDVTDNGTAISSYYESNFSEFGNPGGETRIRSANLYGRGTVTLSYAVNDRIGNYYASGSVPMPATMSGTAPASSRVSPRGSTISFRVDGTGYWVLRRIVFQTEPVRSGR